MKFKFLLRVAFYVSVFISGSIGMYSRLSLRTYQNKRSTPPPRRCRVWGLESRYRIQGWGAFKKWGHCFGKRGCRRLKSLCSLIERCHWRLSAIWKLE